MRQKYHGPLPCTGYSLSIQLATGYQDFLSVFKDDLNFITGQKLGHNAEPKGGVIDEVIDLEMTSKGIGNFLLRVYTFVRSDESYPADEKPAGGFA